MTYVRTEQHRQAIAERNKLNKRKFPIGYDCKSRLYRIWKAMQFRCYQKSQEAYDRYHGRGIGVCNEWRDSYRTFMEWALDNGYENHLTIDRIDNDGNYEPGNCRWVTMREQMWNKRGNHPPITMLGETKHVSEWGEDPRIATTASVFATRIGKGWDPERAFTEPTDTRYGTTITLTAFGETKSPEEWTKDPRCKSSIMSIYTRRKLGWSDQAVIETPLAPKALRGGSH